MYILEYQMKNIYGKYRKKKKNDSGKYLPMSQSISLTVCSFSAITNHTQANQCATSEKHSINKVSIIAVYCEYLSIFCRRRANRSRRVNFTKCMCDSYKMN